MNIGCFSGFRARAGSRSLHRARHILRILHAALHLGRCFHSLRWSHFAFRHFRRSCHTLRHFRRSHTFRHLGHRLFHAGCICCFLCAGKALHLHTAPAVSAHTAEAHAEHVRCSAAAGVKPVILRVYGGVAPGNGYIGRFNALIAGFSQNRSARYGDGRIRMDRIVSCINRDLSARYQDVSRRVNGIVSGCDAHSAGLDIKRTGRILDHDSVVIRFQAQQCFPDVDALLHMDSIPG